jgi:segregation and condensation protein A
MESSFRVDLNGFRGPLDLLLHLVRKHEVSIVDLPIADITKQFLEYLEILKEIDINAAGDFLEIASTLVEIKSKLALPRPEEIEDEDQVEDPREELVQRLLEYQRIRDAASMLDDQSRQWRQRFTRKANDLPPRRVDPAEQPIADIETWDLVSAFGRIVREQAPSEVSNIVYDDTPITHYMSAIHDRLKLHGRARFSEMFQVGMHKSAMIGIFLAILELIRHHSVRASQEGDHGDIWIYPGDAFEREIDLSEVDTYGAEPESSDEENG